VNIDGLIENADWTKRTWDLPTDLDWYITRYGDDLNDWFVRFDQLPAARAMPQDLRVALLNYLGKVEVWSDGPDGGAITIIKKPVRSLIEQKDLVRTSAGVEKFKQPINTEIVADPTPTFDGGFIELSPSQMDRWYANRVQELEDPEMWRIYSKATKDEKVRKWRLIFGDRRVFQSGTTIVVVSVPTDPKIAMANRDTQDFVVPSDDDLNIQFRALATLQQIAPVDRFLTVEIGDEQFRDYGMQDGVLGFVSRNSDPNTIHLRPRAVMEDHGDGNWHSNALSGPVRGKMSILTHEYGHVLDHRDDQTARDDYAEIMYGANGYQTGVNRYAAELRTTHNEMDTYTRDITPSGREMYAEAFLDWVGSQGEAADRQGYVKYFADKYHWFKGAPDQPPHIDVLEQKVVRHVQDEAYWGKPRGTVITPGMKPQSITQRIDARVRAAKPLSVTVQPGWREASQSEFMEIMSNDLADPALGLRPLQRLMVLQETQNYLDEKWHSGYISDDGTALVITDKQADLLLQPGDIEELQRTLTELQEKAPRSHITVQVDNELMYRMTDGDEGALAATTTGSAQPLIAMTTRIAGKRETLSKKYGTEVAEDWWPSELADMPTGKVILAHEWGHAITDIQEVNDHYDALYSIGERSQNHGSRSWLSQYAMQSPQEFIAESFVAWYLTNGTTKSRGAQSVAKLFHWAEKYPRVVHPDPKEPKNTQHPIVRRTG
jgi:hypothetical protein